ncbi:lysine-rich arabinogalactan protein 19-like [Zingiber officinale]|uniref:lysine-rich arabinogalactan protein 19-like n=1 Tax=Zingiber officinale TaxID=94328 RepID=UPI001C4C4883|nr:lysine-rich arabinogalactan protein 19-like [Zingiber officinale]
MAQKVFDEYILCSNGAIVQIADGSFPLVTFIEGYKFGFVLFIPVFAGSEIGKTIGSTKLNADLYLRRPHAAFNNGIHLPLPPPQIHRPSPRTHQTFFLTAGAPCAFANTATAAGPHPSRRYSSFYIYGSRLSPFHSSSSSSLRRWIAAQPSSVSRSSCAPLRRPFPLAPSLPRRRPPKPPAQPPPLLPPKPPLPSPPPPPPNLPLLRPRSLPPFLRLLPPPKSLHRLQPRHRRRPRQPHPQMPPPPPLLQPRRRRLPPPPPLRRLQLRCRSRHPSRPQYPPPRPPSSPPLRSRPQSHQCPPRHLPPPQASRRRRRRRVRKPWLPLRAPWPRSPHRRPTLPLLDPASPPTK